MRQDEVTQALKRHLREDSSAPFVFEKFTTDSDLIVQRCAPHLQWMPPFCFFLCRLIFEVGLAQSKELHSCL